MADNVFGVPGPLAQRIAEYSDNATKQSQLNRYCERVQEQRLLKARQHNRQSQYTDFVLLNKTAAVLPTSLLADPEGLLEGEALSILTHQSTRLLTKSLFHASISSLKILFMIRKEG